MQHIKYNPNLNFDAIKNIIKDHLTLIVNPFNQRTALILEEHLANNVFEFFERDMKLTPIEAIKKGLMELKVIIDDKLKNYEWILITKKDIYYSRGDNTT